MAGRLIIEAAQPALDSTGKLIKGSKLEFYDATTLAPKNVYSSAALTTSLGSVVTASGGFFPELWANDGDEFRVVLKNAAGTVLLTMKNLRPQIIVGIGTPPRYDNLVSMDRQFWNSDTAAPVTHYESDGFGFLWTLANAPTSQNWYTDFISIVPALGFSASADVYSNFTGGNFRLEVFGYGAAGEPLGSIGSIAALTGPALGWQRIHATVTPATMAALPTLAKVRVLFQTIAAVGSGLKITNIQANHGVNACPVPLAPFILPSFVTPEKCGAIRDGRTDDTAAWQTAVRDGRPVEVAASGRNGFGYKVSSIILDQPVQINFNGGKNEEINGCKLFPIGDRPTFDIRSSDVTIEGTWYYDGSAYTPKTDVPIFSVNLTSKSIENLRIEGMTARQAGGIFHVNPGGTKNTLGFTRLKRWKTFAQRGRGLYLPNVFSSFWMEGLYLEWLAPTQLAGDKLAEINHPMCQILGNDLAGAGGIFMRDVYFQGTNHLETPNNHGIVFDGGKVGGGGLRMQGVDVDGPGGDGMKFTNIAEIYGDDIGINSTVGNGLTATSVAHLLINNLRSNGSKISKPSVSGKYAIELNDTKWCRINGDVSNWSGQAFRTGGTPKYNQVSLVAANCGAGANATDFTNLPLTAGVFTDGNGNRITIDGGN